MNLCVKFMLQKAIVYKYSPTNLKAVLFDNDDHQCKPSIPLVPSAKTMVIVWQHSKSYSIFKLSLENLVILRLGFFFTWTRKKVDQILFFFGGICGIFSTM